MADSQITRMASWLGNKWLTWRAPLWSFGGRHFLTRSSSGLLAHGRSFKIHRPAPAATSEPRLTRWRAQLMAAPLLRSSRRGINKQRPEISLRHSFSAYLLGTQWEKVSSSRQLLWNSFGKSQRIESICQDLGVHVHHLVPANESPPMTSTVYWTALSADLLLQWSADD